MDRFENSFQHLACSSTANWTITIIATVGECVIIVTSGIKIASLDLKGVKKVGGGTLSSILSLPFQSRYASWLFFPCF